MTSKECEEQLESLVEAWRLNEADLNQTDIEAIKHLLLENQMQQDVIISYKTTNLDQAVDIQQLEQENKQLKGVIKTKYDDLESKDKEIIELRNERDRLNKLLNSQAYRDVYVMKHQRDKYKEVIEEAREMISELYDETDDTTLYEITKNSKEFLLQVLDKAKGNK